MKTYIVLFQDNADKADARQKYMSKHLQFLEKNASVIQSAGPLEDGVTGDAAGGLWLLQAKNQNEVTALVESDPFWPTGLRKSIRILQWNRVFHAGNRLLS